MGNETSSTADYNIRRCHSCNTALSWDWHGSECPGCEEMRIKRSKEDKKRRARNSFSAECGVSYTKYRDSDNDKMVIKTVMTTDSVAGRYKRFIRTCHPTSHDMKVVKNGRDLTKQTGSYKTGYTCDYCKKRKRWKPNKVVGVAHCFTCKNYDLCARCYNNEYNKTDQLIEYVFKIASLLTVCFFISGIHLLLIANQTDGLSEHLS